MTITTILNNIIVTILNNIITIIIIIIIIIIITIIHSGWDQYHQEPKQALQNLK